jgi:hypothetical protein
MPTPVVIFVYNRPVHTKVTLDHLMSNHQASNYDVHIFSDGWKTNNDKENVLKTRQIIRNYDGFNSVNIVESNFNKGLANSVIEGVSSILSSSDQVIVLEDDIKTSPNFLNFMEESLRLYKENNGVFSISGYSHPNKILPIPVDYPWSIYFSPKSYSWGWATWKDRWGKVDWSMSNYSELLADKYAQQAFKKSGDNILDMLIKQKRKQIDSWAVRFNLAHFTNHATAIVPVNSLVENIGHDGSGTHCNSTNVYSNTFHEEKELKFPSMVFESGDILSSLQILYGQNLYARIVRYIRKLKAKIQRD